MLARHREINSVAAIWKNYLHKKVLLQKYNLKYFLVGNKHNKIRLFRDLLKFWNFLRIIRSIF